MMREHLQSSLARKVLSASQVHKSDNIAQREVLVMKGWQAELELKHMPDT
jgi:hypothetical protein